MLEALVKEGYDVQYSLGHGIHSRKYRSFDLPDTLRWIWRDQVAAAN